MAGQKILTIRHSPPSYPWDPDLYLATQYFLRADQIQAKYGIALNTLQAQGVYSFQGDFSQPYFAGGEIPEIPYQFTPGQKILENLGGDQFQITTLSIPLYFQAGNSGNATEKDFQGPPPQSTGGLTFSYMPTPPPIIAPGTPIYNPYLPGYSSERYLVETPAGILAHSSSITPVGQRVTFFSLVKAFASYNPRFPEYGIQYKEYYVIPGGMLVTHLLPSPPDLTGWQMDEDGQGGMFLYPQWGALPYGGNNCQNSPYWRGNRGYSTPGTQVFLSEGVSWWIERQHAWNYYGPRKVNKVNASILPALCGLGLLLSFLCLCYGNVSLGRRRKS